MLKRLPRTLKRSISLRAALRERIARTMTNSSLSDHEKGLIVGLLIDDIEQATKHEVNLREEYTENFYSDDKYGSRPGENGWHDYEESTSYSESCSDRYENFHNQY